MTATRPEQSGNAAMGDGWHQERRAIERNRDLLDRIAASNADEVDERQVP